MQYFTLVEIKHNMEKKIHYVFIVLRYWAKNECVVVQSIVLTPRSIPVPG